VEQIAPAHRCVTYDARGYGETLYEPEEAWSPVTDAVAVLDAAACEQAWVVAASMGGRTAIDLVFRYPERVTGLVLIGSGVSGSPVLEMPDVNAQELIEAIDAAESEDDLAEVNRLEAWLWLDGPDAPERRVSDPARALFLDMNGRALRAPDPGSQLVLEPAWERLEEIALPALVMVGALDLKRLRDTSLILAGKMPAARFEKLAGVAHLPHLERDPATLRHISEFIAAHPS
jgi:pimeloyl-ACP methyl ester carboxylesterase